MISESKEFPATALLYSCTSEYKVQQFRCYRSGLRHLLGEYGGIEADRQSGLWLLLVVAAAD